MRFVDGARPVMGRVHKVTWEEVMSEDEFAAWWSEHHLHGEAFVDVLRRHLATKLQLKNFRRFFQQTAHGSMQS